LNPLRAKRTGISAFLPRILIREEKIMPLLFRKLAVASAIVVVLAFLCLNSLPAQPADTTTQGSVTVTVTALGEKSGPAPVIPQEDITAYSGSTRLKVINWTRAQGNDANLELAILIDNDLGPSLLGRQMQDLDGFVKSLPPSTEVGIFYAQNGTANEVAEFTKDHDAAAKSLHLTEGRQGGSPSIYLSLADLASHWQPANSARREALVIASGFDPLYPGIEDPYADSAVSAAEKAGIDVHIIMIPNPKYENSFGDNISEGKLIEATKGSGGQVLFEGAFVPVSLSPYLQQLGTALDNQYLLTVSVDRTTKKGGELIPFRVQTEQHGVKLYAPEKISVP
jgi:hypothetical protein